MKELWGSIITTYNNYHGTGKGLTLFLVSVLIICLLKANPLMFVLSPVSGIGYAFSSALKKYRSRSVPAGILAGLLVILTLMLSGGWTFSEADHYRTENLMHLKQEHINVMDTLLSSEEGTIRVMASPDISPWMKVYSDRFDVMFAYPDLGDKERLDGKARFIYEQMLLPTPDETRVVETVREAGYDHIVYDTSKTYFELPLEEYDYELIGEVSGYKIYRDNSKTNTAPVPSSVNRIRAIITIVLSLSFIILCLVIALRTPGKKEEEGRDKDIILIPVLALILCQILGVMIFSYDDPAALPAGIYSGTGLIILYSVLPLLMIPAYYFCYFRLAGSLFEDKRYARLMVLFICVLNLWGYQSEALLPVTMLYSWFTPSCVVVHGLLPLALCLIIDKCGDKEKKLESMEEPAETEENDYYKWEEEEMKNHKIINSRNLAIALIIVIVLFAGSVFVMNRKINSLYDTTVNLQQQVEELKGSDK